MLSQAVEDYLKTIYKLQGEGAASTTDIARSLDVSAASVTKMAKRLAQLKLVTYESYRGVTLTDAGRKIALEIIRHHRLLETYLREVLGYSWDMMHEEAEHLEHHISEEFEKSIERMLGYPTHDPHGDPIPTREGVIADEATDPLERCRAGQHVRISRVAADDPGLLSYLEEAGLLPGQEVAVIARSQSTRELTVSGAKGERRIGFDIARKVYVSPDDENPAAPE